MNNGFGINQVGGRDGGHLPRAFVMKEAGGFSSSWGDKLLSSFSTRESQRLEWLLGEQQPPQRVEWVTFWLIPPQLWGDGRYSPLWLVLLACSSGALTPTVTAFLWPPLPDPGPAGPEMSAGASCMGCPERQGEAPMSQKEKLRTEEALILATSFSFPGPAIGCLFALERPHGI